MTNAEIQTVIKWAWRHGSMVADEYSTLDQAVLSAVWASDSGDESLHAIEVIYVGGRSEVHDRKACDALMRPIEDKQYEVYRSQPTPTVILDIQAPTGEWSAFENYVGQTEAGAAARKWSDVLGADRVHLRSYGTLRGPGPK
jgi:hypothetical protein